MENFPANLQNTLKKDQTAPKATYSVIFIYKKDFELKIRYLVVRNKVFFSDIVTI